MSIDRQARRGRAVEKKREELVKRLKAMILDPARYPGRFPEGKLPPERELAAELGVSRGLLREAIVTLEAFGLIEVRERQGAFITMGDPADLSASMRRAAFWPGDLLINLMEMRLLIEPPIAGQAAIRRDEADLAKLRTCLFRLAELEDDTETGDPLGAEWDSMLHTLVVEAAKNPILTRLYEGMRSAMDDHIRTSRLKLLSLKTWPDKIRAEHGVLVDAIAAGDPAAAIEAQRRHLGGALAMLRAQADEGLPGEDV